MDIVTEAAAVDAVVVAGVAVVAITVAVDVQ